LLLLPYSLFLFHFSFYIIYVILCVHSKFFSFFFFFFFFNDTPTTEIYTLSLHDALPIWAEQLPALAIEPHHLHLLVDAEVGRRRSEEHTSELQLHLNLVCRLLLEKKKKKNK